MLHFPLSNVFVNVYALLWSKSQPVIDHYLLNTIVGGKNVDFSLLFSYYTSGERGSFSTFTQTLLMDALRATLAEPAGAQIIIFDRLIEDDILYS